MDIYAHFLDVMYTFIKKISTRINFFSIVKDIKKVECPKMLSVFTYSVYQYWEYVSLHEELVQFEKLYPFLNKINLFCIFLEYHVHILHINL